MFGVEETGNVGLSSEVAERLSTLWVGGRNI